MNTCKIEEHCGVFIVNKRLEILTVHFKGKSLKSWSIPTDNRICSEPLENTVIRGLSQKTGLVGTSQDLIYLGISHLRGRSAILHGFFLTFEKTNSILRAIQENDEIDAYRWVDMSRAHSLIHRSQSDFLIDIQDYMIRLSERN